MTSIRDPLWNTIVLDDVARRLIDTPVFQRLRYVRQLGLAHLVYPGATHTRFEHALGAYHLARRTIGVLDERRELEGAIPPDERGVVTTAALLHDIGHHPFSHALEEIGAQHHEVAARPLITHGPIADELRASIAPDAPERVYALIRGRSTSPLQGLISGSLDLDKIEYLKRDAFMCGVPYGEIDVDRLLGSLTFAGQGGARVAALHEKGVAALESLLFAKYQMYRNVYWHHAVRSATVMFKRVVVEAIAAKRLSAADVAVATDDALLQDLLDRDTTGLARRLRERRLAKRALDIPATDLPADTADWPATDPGLAARVEVRLARELKVPDGLLLLDFPAKSGMLDVDWPLVKRDGSVTRLSGGEAGAHLGLPRVATELYRSARRLRIFVLEKTAVPERKIVELVRLPQAEIRARLDGEKSLL
ncbi:MAG TPA: HD domain-containing protein [Gemmatimonadales bacterium]|nr:HD domain-containing protein [Gemmatimonadales bacterium]